MNETQTPQTPQKVTEQATRAIRYIFCNKQGDIKHFDITTVQQNEDDDVNLELFAPTQLRGEAKIRFDALVMDGYFISNWHVITLSVPGSAIHAPLAPSDDLSPKSDLPAAVKEVIKQAQRVTNSRSVVITDEVNDLFHALAALGEHEKQ